MAPPTPSIAALATDPLALAAATIVGGWFVAHYLRPRNHLSSVLVQLLAFIGVTGFLFSAGVVPYHPASPAGGESRRLIVGALEIVWWLALAWLATGAMRTIRLLSRRPREAKLVQDLVAAIIYLTAAFAIVGNVFDFPLKGLLATSGVVAIVIGLALQSSLGDVFSGIVLNIERPYRVGDWIVIDDAVQGRVIETNWRATHILNKNQDVAIVPNSVIAKARVVNCSSPTKNHASAIRVKLDPDIGPVAGRNLLKEVLLGSSHILRTPAPAVTVKDISAEMIDFELAFSVADMADVDLAANDLFDQVFRATAAVGARFAPRLSAAAPAAAPPAEEEAPRGTPQRLLAGISLFSTLSAEEKAALAQEMKRHAYKAGEVVLPAGAVSQVLHIVSKGVLVATAQVKGEAVEVTRVGRGGYFGEIGLLTGEALNGEIKALTPVVIYEIAKEALSPLLKARPGMAEELSESLAIRRLANKAVLDRTQDEGPHPEALADRVAANIKRLFELR